MSGALTYALIDQTLSVGVEALVEPATEAESRSDPAYECLIGPSVNVHPTRNSFVTVAPLLGATADSPEAEIFVVAGFQFRFGGPASEPTRPVGVETETFGSSITVSSISAAGLPPR